MRTLRTRIYLALGVCCLLAVVASPAAAQANPRDIAIEHLSANAVALGLTAREISARIAAADGKVQSGRLQSSALDITINVSGEIEALDRLARVVLRENDSGASVLLSDIARIERKARYFNAKHFSRRQVIGQAFGPAVQIKD